MNATKDTEPPLYAEAEISATRKFTATITETTLRSGQILLDVKEWQRRAPEPTPEPTPETPAQPEIDA